MGVSSLGADLSLAFRGLRRAPAFTAAALATLTLGSGAVIAMLAIVRSVLVAPLPFPEEGLVYIRGTRLPDAPQFPLSWLDIAALGEHASAFASMSPVTNLRSFNLAAGGAVEHVRGEMVAEDYFRTFGVALALGRAFTAGEARPPGQTVAVISHALWQRHFGGAASALDSALTLNDRVFQIVGVGPEGFRGFNDDAELWLPIGVAGAIYNPAYTEVREFRWLGAVARIRFGTPLETARADAAAVMRRLEQAYPKENRMMGVQMAPLREVYFGDIRRPLAVLLAAAAFVLLVGTVNVANLLLARGVARRREIATRMALGAGRWRIVRLVLIETALVSIGGSAGGTLFALAICGLVAPLASAELQTFVRIGLDPRSVAWIFALTAVAAAVCGLMPALAVSRAGLLPSLRESERSGTSRSTRRLQQALIFTESAIALALLIGSGLAVRGLSHLLDTDLGFQPNGLVTLRLDLTAEKFRDNDRYRGVVSTVLEAAGSVSGIESCALEGPGLPTGGFYGISFRRAGSLPDASDVSAVRHHVTPGYFQTLGIRRLAGRDFNREDGPASPRAIVVSESFVRRYFPEGAALGARLLSLGPSPVPFVVIGIVTDVRHGGLDAASFGDPDVYVSLEQTPARTPAVITLVARTSLPPAAASASLRAAVRRMVPDLPPYDVRTMEARLAQQTSRSRYAATVLAAFAIAALGLAAVGVYGVSAYLASARRREVSVRLALGATPGHVRWILVRGGVGPVVFGAAAALALSPLLAQSFAAMLYGLSPLDWPTIAISTAVLLACAVGATLLSGRDVTRLDAAEALRLD